MSSSDTESSFVIIESENTFGSTSSEFSGSPSHDPFIADHHDVFLLTTEKNKYKDSSTEVIPKTQIYCLEEQISSTKQQIDNKGDEKSNSTHCNELQRNEIYLRSCYCPENCHYNFTLRNIQNSPDITLLEHNNPLSCSRDKESTISPNKSQSDGQSSQEKIFKRSKAEGRRAALKDREQWSFHPTIRLAVSNAHSFREQCHAYRSKSLPCINISTSHSNNDNKNLQLTKNQKSETDQTKENQTIDRSNELFESVCDTDICNLISIAKYDSDDLKYINYHAKNVYENLSENVDINFDPELVFMESRDENPATHCAGPSFKVPCCAAFRTAMCVCDQEVQKLKLQLQEYKEKLIMMENQMSHQNQYIEQLRAAELRRTEETMRSYPDNFGYHTSAFHSPSGYQTRNCPPHYSSPPSSTELALPHLMQQLISLKIENTNLTSSLEQERSKRKNAEVNVSQHKDYIKRLENGLQTLKSTRVVMDPMTYKNVADSYIASRCKVSRTQHKHLSFRKEDLVCDRLTPLRQNDDWSNYRSSSCPTTPPGVNVPVKPLYYPPGPSKTPPPPSTNRQIHHDVCRTSSLDSSCSYLGLSVFPSAPSSQSEYGSDRATINSSLYPQSISPVTSKERDSFQSSTPLSHSEYKKLIDNLEKLEDSDT